MATAEIVSLSVIAFALGMQILHSFWFRDTTQRTAILRYRFAWLFWGGAAFLFIFALRETYLLYEGWRLNSLGRLLLPPYRSWTYFAGYAGSRFFAPWFIAMLASGLGVWAARALNRRYGERFFEGEEPLIFGTAILFTGYPALLFYAIILGIAAIFWVSAARFFGYQRAPLYYLWLPAALIAIIIVYKFVPADALAQFSL